MHASHVNYGLREGADEGEAAARRLCAALRIDLHVERPRRLPAGNLQAAARTVRYDAARRLRDRTGAAVIVTGHTRTDVAETTLYRLAASPGSRALLGLAPRSGRVVRPLLGLGRERVRELAVAAGLPFADDETNADPTYARNRIRAEVLPVLRDVNPGAEPNIAETRAELAEEAALLERVVLEALADAGADAGAVAISAAAMAGWEPGLRRLALRALAERAAGRHVPLGRGARAEIERLAARPRAARSSSAAAWSPLRVGIRSASRAAAEDAAPAPRRGRPGAPGRWRASATGRCAPSFIPGPVEPAGPDLATLDAESLEGALEVRTWREGDRIRPLGMTGTKTLGDLFTDGGVPRSLRRTLPVVTVDGAGRLGGRASPSPRTSGSTRDAERVAVLTARRARVAYTRERRACAAEWSRRRAIGETLVEADELQRRVAELGRRDQPRLRRPRPGDDRGAQGRGAVPRRPHARARDPLRGRLHGGLVLRLVDRLLRRRPDPQGPRRLDRRPRRAPGRGHRRFRASPCTTC